MKSLVWTLLAFSMLPVGASAGTVTGRATLTLWLDNGGIASLEIREEDGVLVGHSDLSSNGVFRVEQLNDRLKGYADGGFVDLTCSSGSCSGMVGGGSVTTKYTVNGSDLDLSGSLNHVSIDVKIDSKKIQVWGDGSLELKAKPNGTWSGMGFLSWDPRSRFTADLEVSGSLASRVTDPGFVLTTLVAPLVRN